MIHTFGDSHSWNGFEKMPGINIHHLGPKLMHSVGRDGLDILNIKNFSVNDGDYVIFSFGEIDCRCHIKKYCNDENDYTKIIDNIINNYALTVEMNSNLITDVKICLYNVPPPLKRCYVSGYGMVLLDPNYEFRFTASDEERQMYAEYMNYKLKQLCLEKNYIFIDVYDKYCDSEKFLEPIYSDYVLHISDPIYIKEFISEHLKTY